MSWDWQSNWNPEAELRPGASLPPRRGTHRRSNSTPLENTSPQLLAAAGSVRSEELDYAADTAEILEDVLHNPVLTKARSERLRGRGEPRSTRRGLVQPSLSDRQTGAGAQRVSGRMTKGKGKLAVLHEAFESSDEEGDDSGEDGYGHAVGRGGKVKRVLANRQSAQRSRIRKLQHISELEETLQGLQDDVHKLTPQLTKLQAKQAGLDDENRDLRQKLSSLMQESRNKDSVNQGLTQEVSELKLKKENAALDHQQQQLHQQRQQQLHQQQPQAYATTTSAQVQHQNMHSTQDLNAFGSPRYAPYPSYQQGFPSNSQGQMHSYFQPEVSSPVHAQNLRQIELASGSPAASADEPDIVDRLMKHYSYDQSQAWQRKQQQLQQQQQQQQQHRQQQQQQPMAQDRSTQQQQRGRDMLAELDNLPGRFDNNNNSQQSQEYLSGARYSLQQTQAHPSHHVRQSSQDSVEEHSSPQLLFPHGYQQANPDYSSAPHDYGMSHQQRLQQQGGQSQSAFMPQHQGLDALKVRHTQDNASLQRSTSEQAVHSSSGNPSAFSHPHRQNFDGGHPQQPDERQQLMLRSQSLSQPKLQASLQRRGEGSSLQQLQQQQQHTMYQRAHSTGTEQPSANEAVRHLQRHSTGQTHANSSPRFIQLNAQFRPASQSQSQSQSQYPFQSWEQPQSQMHSPQLSQRSLRDGSGAAEGLHPNVLPKQKSSGDMTRHGSGSTDGPLSEYGLPDGILRSFSSVSNASSEQSDSAAHGAAHLGLAARPVSGSYQRPEGQTGQHAGPGEAPRHGTWVKGMPPSGKKKKDSSVHKAALTKLI